MYDFHCEHCGGTVRERRVAREALRHKGNFVILEHVPIGICDQCGAWYFDASILRRVKAGSLTDAESKKVLKAGVVRE